MNHPVFVDNGSGNFMASFLNETIPGAEFDSSDRHMPLRCHPGTRLEIIKRCQDFILDRDGRPKIRWVVGAAGVGKSAIMQSVAHDESKLLSDIIVGATIFFSINGRQDGSKAITTIAYQLAVKIKLYCRFVQQELTDDPSLYRKSLSRQFDKFIVEPFVHQRILPDSSRRLLIIIDGLDECANPSTQRELLELISNFCITYPTSPIVWIVASRPEPHIASFFAQPNIALLYEKEEIVVDSDEAYKDVKRYLRDKFREIQVASTTLQPLAQWPSESDFLKVANASGGLFAYASTVVRHISDPDYGDPVALLDDVLKIIKTGTNENIWGRNHPMAQLDALYSHIMSKIPTNVMANTRKLLLLNLRDGLDFPFQFQCNMLGMTQNAAYSATHHIRSIALVPKPTRAAEHCLVFSHKSFPDYLRNFERSGFSPDIKSEAERLWVQCVLRILEGACDGVCVDAACDKDLKFGNAALKNGSGSCGDIPVSWPGVREHGNCEIRLNMFCIAVWETIRRFGRGEEAFRNLLCVRVLASCFTKLPTKFPFDAVRDFVFYESRRLVLTTCFTFLPMNFPFDAVRDFAFDASQRHELLNDGTLKQVPLETLDYTKIDTHKLIQLRFRGPTTEHSDPWNVSCRHKREGRWESDSQDWVTGFTPVKNYIQFKCRRCWVRFTARFNTQSAGHLATVLSITSDVRLVELQFADPEDGVADWTCRFVIVDGFEDESDGDYGDPMDSDEDEFDIDQFERELANIRPEDMPKVHVCTDWAFVP